MEATTKSTIKGQEIGMPLNKELSQSLKRFLTDMDIIIVASETEGVSKSQIEKIFYESNPYLITEKNIVAIQKLIERAITNIGNHHKEVEEVRDQLEKILKEE